MRILLVCSCLLMISCEDNLRIQDDDHFDISGFDGYPATIYKLDSLVHQQKVTAFLDSNTYLVSGLNQFGFCDFSANDPDRPVNMPPANDTFSQEEIIERVIDFIARNPEATGIANPEEVTFTSVHHDTNPDDMGFWSLKTENQKVGDLEILHSQVVFHVINGEIRDCYGNWFPMVVIPDTFRISSSKAKSMLVNRRVTHYTISGDPYYKTISETDLNNATSGLVVYPVRNEEKIALYVTWEIIIPDPVYFKFYIDVMTGEIIQEEPTIIS